MRYPILVSAYVLSGFILVGCTTTPEVTSTENTTVAVPNDGEVAVITGKGMGCPLCATNADRTLSKVPGVNWVNIDLGNGRIEVGVDEANKPTDADLKNAINDAGFTAGAVSWQKTEEAE